MNKKHNAAQRVIDFFEGKGFYIILFLCVAAIGISGYVLFFAGFGETPDTQPQDYLLEEPDWTPQPIEDMTQDAAVAAGGKAEVVIETMEPSPSRTPAATVKPSATPAPSAAAKPVKSPYVWPVKGRIAVPFAVDELVYDSTMGDWRVHPGIDIEAALNAKVMAISDGVVEDVYEDELMGTTVVILHADGLRSVYANLIKKATVTPEQKVKCGDVIGAVGDTSIAEWGVVSHLHLEIIRDGGQIDPTEILPKQ